MDAYQLTTIREGMTKQEVLARLGNPYETEFLDPSTEEAVAPEPSVTELMTYYYAEEHVTSRPTLWRGPQRQQTGRRQRFEVLLENDRVVKHYYTEEQL